MLDEAGERGYRAQQRESVVAYQLQARITGLISLLADEIRSLEKELASLTSTKGVQ